MLDLIVMTGSDAYWIKNNAHLKQFGVKIAQLQFSITLYSLA